MAAVRFFIYASPQIAISIVCVCITTASTACLQASYLLSCILKTANAAIWWAQRLFRFNTT